MTTSYVSKLSGLILCVSFVLTLYGCATNSVATLINASKKVEPQLPSATTVNSELKGRSFEIGSIYFDIVNDDPKQRLDISGADITTLFESRLRQGFTSANLSLGMRPAYIVSVAIVDLKLRQGVTLLPNIFRVRLEISRPDQIKVMSAELQARYLHTIPIIMPGLVGALPTYNSALAALSEMLPATAVVITKTVLGLQEGKTLDDIEGYPDSGIFASYAGAVISPPHLFLKGHPFGIYPLSSAELANIVSQLNKQP